MVLVAFTEDIYQDIMIKEKLAGLDEVVAIRPDSYNEIQEFRYSYNPNQKGLIITTDNKKVIEAYKDLETANWFVVFKVSSYRDLKGVIPKDEVTFLPYLKEYGEKKEFFKQRILRLGCAYKNDTVIELMTKSLIREPEKYKNVLTFRDSVEKGYVITMDNLTDIFGNVDFYNLDDTLIHMILGTGGRKFYKQYHYFTELKGYPWVWVKDELLKMCVMVDYYFNMYRKGVLIAPIGYKEYSKRATVIGYMPIDEDDWPKIGTQYKLLNITKNKHYKDVKKLLEIYMREEILTEEELVARIMEVRLLSKELGVNKYVYRRK